MKAKKSSSNPAARARTSNRIKCACASCNCMVDLDKGLRKGNVLYCSRACLTECTFEDCACDHDCCKP
jgi:hypothetical protein